MGIGGDGMRVILPFTKRIAKVTAALALSGYKYKADRRQRIPVPLLPRHQGALGCR